MTRLDVSVRPDGDLCSGAEIAVALQHTSMKSIRSGQSRKQTIRYHEHRLF
jgi:hypothetical protein